MAIPNLAIFGHTKFIPVLLGNIVKKKLEHPFLAIPNLYQSFWEKLLEKKFRMAIFGHTKFIPGLLGKIVRKNLEWPFLAMPNLYQSSWEKLPEKNWNNHIWPFLIYTSLLGKICWKKFRMAIPNLYQSS